MSYIKPEDYEEPVCPLCTDKSNITSIPVKRVIEKLDFYLKSNDYNGAERHLLYWKNEAVAGNDARGQFAVLNELLGLYRKLNRKDDAFKSIESIIKVIELLDAEDSLFAATAYLNIGTVYKAFGEIPRSIDFFEKSKQIYESELYPYDIRLAGLYNNYALALCDNNDYESALTLYNKAIKINEYHKEEKLNLAITHLNIADLYHAMYGESAEEKIENELNTAEELLDSNDILHDSYYAFVCEKCADTFDFYGRFYYKNELLKRTKEIYERS